MFCSNLANMLAISLNVLVWLLSLYLHKALQLREYNGKLNNHWHSVNNYLILNIISHCHCSFTINFWNDISSFAEFSGIWNQKSWRKISRKYIYLFSVCLILLLFIIRITVTYMLIIVISNLSICLRCIIYPVEICCEFVCVCVLFCWMAIAYPFFNYYFLKYLFC